MGLNAILAHIQPSGLLPANTNTKLRLRAAFKLITLL